MTRARLLTLVAYLGFMVAWSANTALGAEMVNYSGKYSLQVTRMASSKLDLEVIQSKDSIEVTRMEESSKTTNRYPLNGSDGDYKSRTGSSGRCKAQLKGKYLVLESVVTARPQPNAAPMRIHTKERWQLSSDSKILTVKSEVSFPDVPRDVSSFVGESVSGTEKYTRVGNP